MTPNLLALLAAIGLALPAAVPAQTFNACGPLENSFGPFDYRDSLPEQKGLVESAHFTPAVEALIRGVTARLPGPDIDYTLRAFPNHHRALLATIRLGQREKQVQPGGMRYSVECWLDRAVRWRPDDPIVRMIYASWLGPNGKRDAALRQLAEAERLAGDNPFTHYNVGLSYLELGEHERALAKAHQAMAMGIARTELADALRAAGRWRDPPAPAPAEGAASAAPTS